LFHFSFSCSSESITSLSIKVFINLSSKKMNIEIFGKPWTILKFNQDEKSFQDDSDKLKNLFLHEKVKDRQVVVFSIVGSFRRGKSFFLDYCLRYLYANVSIKSSYFMTFDQFRTLWFYVM